MGWTYLYRLDGKTITDPVTLEMNADAERAWNKGEPCSEPGEAEDRGMDLRGFNK